LDVALILPSDNRPRGERLVEALREAILSGRLRAGEQLPPTRALAAQLGLARGTVVIAYEELIAEGYCAARTGAGTFVTIEGGGTRPRVADAPPRLSAWGERLQPGTTPSAPPVRWDFSSGRGGDRFPTHPYARALNRAVAGIAAQEGPGGAAGNPRLRAALAAYLARARAVRATAEEVIVVSGGQQGIDLASRLLLDPGDAVVVEEPAYYRARAVFAALGARVIGVPVDSGGLQVDRLPESGARLVYVTPSHQFPTGAVLAPERRLALTDWVARHDAWLLEDDYDSEFRYSGPPLPSVQGLDRAGRCLYLGSLSKLLHPALRVGYLVVPPALATAATAAKSTLDTATNPTVQEALAELFETGEIDRHLHRAGREYRQRQQRLLSACAAHLPRDVTVWPLTGGLHLFLEAPCIDSERLRKELAARGVAATDGRPCYLQPPTGATLLLWFSRIGVDAIVDGVAALGEALRAAGGNLRSTPSR
jgi:GntR family transcriptional regulator/MocR family aminotransferase